MYGDCKPFNINYEAFVLSLSLSLSLSPTPSPVSRDADRCGFAICLHLIMMYVVSSKGSRHRDGSSSRSSHPAAAAVDTVED